MSYRWLGIMRTWTETKEASENKSSSENTTEPQGFNQSSTVINRDPQKVISCPKISRLTCIVELELKAFWDWALSLILKTSPKLQS